MSEEEFCEKTIIITCSEYRILSNGSRGSIVTFYLKDINVSSFKKKISFIEFCDVNARKEYLKNENEILIKIINDHLEKLMQDHKVYVFSGFFNDKTKKDQYKNKYNGGNYIPKGCKTSNMSEKERSAYLLERSSLRREYQRQYMERRRKSLEDNQS